MSNKSVARIAWTLCVMVVIAAVFDAILSLRANDTVFNVAGSVTTFTIFAVTGALIISHQPRNEVGWLLMMEAALVFVVPLDTYFNNLNQAPAQLSLPTMIGLWIYGWAWLWYIFPALFIPLFFPTGKLPSPRWRWVVALGLGLCLFFILFATFSLEFINPNETWSVPNPIGFLQDDAFPGGLWMFLLLSFVILSVVSLFVRYRHAGRVEREQIKWLLYAAALFSGSYALTLVSNEIGGTIDDLLRALRDLAITLLPIAIAIAILRHRLYDIDLVIRKTLVYAVLTGLLALVYFGAVILLQTLVGRAANEQSPLVIVLSTLLIAALSTPLRRRVQRLIDRRFYRQRYDARRVLASFAQTARDEVELAALTAELEHVVQETVQPSHMTVWLKVSNENV